MTATKLIPSSLTELPSVGRHDDRLDSADAKRAFRFGVAFRLLSAFAAITVFAIAISAIAIYTFGKYGDGFNRIASSNVPALVAASNLAQRSQALAANAPNLAAADGHFGRRAVSEALQSQLQAIAEAGEQVKMLAPATKGLDSLVRNEASLREKLETLDALCAQAVRGQLSQILFEAVDPLEQTLAQYGRESPNIFDVRNAQLASGSAVRGALLDTKEASAQFVASAERIFTDIQMSEQFLRRCHFRLFVALHDIVFAVRGRSVRRVSLRQPFDHPAAAETEREHARCG
jgi:hypothetical protein